GEDFHVRAAAGAGPGDDVVDAVAVDVAGGHADAAAEVDRVGQEVELDRAGLGVIDLHFRRGANRSPDGELVERRRRRDRRLYGGRGVQADRAAAQILHLDVNGERPGGRVGVAAGNREERRGRGRLDEGETRRRLVAVTPVDRAGEVGDLRG